MITLGTAIGGAALAMGGKKAEDPTTPPINAKNKDEENFVKCVHVHTPHSPVPRTAILHESAGTNACAETTSRRLQRRSKESNKVGARREVTSLRRRTEVAL
jgi:hypothetical protein